MKTSKSRKITLLVALMLLSLILAFGFLTVKPARADEAPEDCFVYTGREADSGDITFSDNFAKIKMYDDKIMEFSQKLLTDDFSLTFKLNTTDMSNFRIIFFGSSADPNGNKKTENGKTVYAEEIENIFYFDFSEAHNLKVSFDKEDFSSRNTTISSFDINQEITVGLKKALGGEYYRATVSAGGGVEAVLSDGSISYNAEEQDYYRLDKTSAPVSRIGFVGQKTDGTSYELQIKSVDQKASDVSGAFKQTFEMTDGAFTAKARARAVLADGFYNYNSSLDKCVVAKGIKHTLSFKASSFVNESASFTLESSDAATVIDGLNVMFTETGDKTLTVKNGAGDTVDTISVTVVDASLSTNAAPEYNMDADAIEAFKYKLNHMIYTYDENDAKTGMKLTVGDNLTLTADMFKAMVYDDDTAFSKLSATLYFFSDSNNGTSGSYKITLSEAGKYKFYVLFSDRNSNSMKSDDFYRTDVNDANQVIYGIYQSYIFEFNIDDVSELSVKGSSQGTGYVNTEYNAADFDIKGKSYSAVYTLYYSKTDIDASDEGWTEIIAESKATDKEATYGDYTYEQIKAIAYDGELKFTPDKAGFYKIVCKATSSSNALSDENSVIITVKEQIKKVTPDSHWLQNNVWSVVFLSVGTCCLIGILLLLFVKPKKKGDGSED